MTKMKCIKQIEELNGIVNIHSKKIIQHMKAEYDMLQNNKIKDVLDKISKDYSLSITDLYDKYLPTKSNLKTIKLTIIEPLDEPIEEEQIIEKVYDCVEIKGTTYFISNNILYNENEKKVGCLKKDKYVFDK
jgi:hypothetical protein